MKPSQRNKQVYLAIFSALLGLLLVVGVMFGSTLFNHRIEIKQTRPVATKNKEIKTSREVAEKAVSHLEEDPSQEAAKKAEELVAELDSGSEKDSLKARLMVIQTKLKNKKNQEEAEKAVAYLESRPDLSNISLAKAAVAKVTGFAVKKTLEERIAQVQENLVSKGITEPKEGDRPATVVAPIEEEIYVTEESQISEPSKADKAQSDESTKSEVTEITESSESSKEVATIVAEVDDDTGDSDKFAPKSEEE